MVTSPFCVSLGIHCPFTESSRNPANVTDPLTVDAILGPQGRIARRLERYEPREQQLAMARKVAEALAGGEHLVAEAGTGTGKSFAYLVPAILHATADQREAKGTDRTPPARKPRVLVSTHTISLQEQLIHKDVPFLRSVLPLEFTGNDTWQSLGLTGEDHRKPAR